MESMTLKKLCVHPDLLEPSASWFFQKWGVPLAAYKESMQECIDKKTGIPQWYVVLDKNQEIIAGAGIIENDFHDRKDLSPNLCALFVEEKHRNQGIAKLLLDSARKDLGDMGFERLYLITSHKEFYERCGWEFLTTVTDDDGNSMRMYVASTLS